MVTDKASLRESTSLRDIGRQGKNSAAIGFGMQVEAPRKKICIVGGGFGGLYTALNLVKLQPLLQNTPKPEITLIDTNDRYV